MECRECGHEDCPCDECHGEQQWSFIIDTVDPLSGRHHQIEVECFTCHAAEESARADDLNQRRVEDEMARAEVEQSLYAGGVTEDPDVDGGLLG